MPPTRRSRARSPRTWPRPWETSSEIRPSSLVRGAGLAPVMFIPCICSPITKFLSTSRLAAYPNVCVLVAAPQTGWPLQQGHEKQLARQMQDCDPNEVPLCGRLAAAAAAMLDSMSTRLAGQRWLMRLCLQYRNCQLLHCIVETITAAISQDGGICPYRALIKPPSAALLLYGDIMEFHEIPEVLAGPLEV